MSKNSILVVGDVMIDKYVFTNGEKLSPEGPVPCLRPKDKTEVLGGAANVAFHVANADIPCIFAFKSALDSPAYATFDFMLQETSYGNALEISDGINEEHIKMCKAHRILRDEIALKYVNPLPLCFDHHYPTTKTRIYADGQQVCRIDEEDTNKPGKETENIWFEIIGKTIDKNSISAVVFSDYDKGTLTNLLIQRIVDYCNERDITTIMDPKLGSFCRLKGLTVVKPNRKELMKTTYDAQTCSKLLGDTYLVNTLGQEGMKIWQNGRCIFSYPTLASEVVNVISAGDSVNAMIAICLYNGMNIEQAVMAATKAAAYNLQHMGSYVLTKSEIEKCIDFGEENS